MPTVTIDRSRAALPTRTGINEAGRVTPDTNAGRGMMELGGTLLKIDAEMRRETKLAEDSTYVANASIQAQQAAYDIQKKKQEEFRNNPEGYAKALFQDTQAVYQQAIDAAPSGEARRALQSQLAGSIRADFSQAAAWERKNTVDTYLTRHRQSTTMLANRIFESPEDAQRVIASHNALTEASTTFLEPGQAARLKEQDTKELSNAAIRGLIEKDPHLAEDVIKSGQFNKVFEPTQLETFEQMAKRKQVSNDLAADKLFKVEKEKSVNELELSMHFASSLDDVNSIQEKIETGFHDETLSTKEFIKYSDKLEKIQQRIIGDSADLQMVDASYRQATPLSAVNKKSRGAVDNYYAQIFLPTLQGLNPSEQANKITGFVANTGIVPTPVRSQVEEALSGGSPARQTAAADLAMNIINQNPILTKQFNRDRLNYARKISDGRNAGLSAEEAVEAAKVQVMEKGTEPYKARQKDFKDQKKDFDTGEINQWFRDDPNDVPDNMKNDFNRLYQTFYVDQQMSEKAAREMAYKRLLTQWGVSSISGEARWMRNAPETVYGVPGQDNEWMKKDLQATVAGKTDKPVSVVQNPATTASDEPDYFVIYEDDDGVIHHVPSSNDPDKPLRWKPSWEASEQFKKVEAERIKREEELRKATPDLRKRQLQLQKDRDIRNTRFGIVPQE